MAVNINVPSQVKTFANLAAFPATGALKTIYIAEDTNKTYRWTGSVYVEVSGADFSGYVPTSRTLTINGTTQDLSADRTFTISTGITIGTTAITSGTVGRVLFQGTGNVVQQSSSLSYDDTLKVFSVTGPIGSVFQHTSLTNYNGFGGFQLNIADGSERAFLKLNPTSGEVRIGATGSGYFPTFYAQGVEAMRIFASTRNVGINTTTDAGFRLDVNGTARVQNTATIIGTNPFLFINNTSSGLMGVGYQKDGVDQAYTGIASSAGAGIVGSLQHDYFIRSLGRRILFSTTGGAVQAMLFSTGNFAINTTTDAGFKLDVNGTARATQITATTAGGSFNVGSVNVVDFGDGLRIGYSSSVSKISLFTNSGTQGLQVNNGSVSIGPQLTPNASAILDLTSTTKGFLPPRMTTTQRNAIASPAAGLMVYDTTLNVIMYYNGTMWI